MRSTLATLLVLLASGGASTMHWASGTLHYEGHDPSGPFSGDTGATSCAGSFNLAGGAGVQIDGSRRGYVVEVGGDPAPAVIVGAPGALYDDATHRPRLRRRNAPTG